MRHRTLAVSLAILALLGCSDSSQPNLDVVRDPSGVDPLKLNPSAPALETDSVSFYAVSGKDRFAEIFFDSAGVRTNRLLRFDVNRYSLYRNPDGSRIHSGDSLLITVRITDPTTLAFDFEPSGLQFTSWKPAVLTIGLAYANTTPPPSAIFRDHGSDSDGHHCGWYWGWCGHGGQQAQDSTGLAIWVQEDSTNPYLRLQSTVDSVAQTIKADVPNFSRYAVAY